MKYQRGDSYLRIYNQLIDRLASALDGKAMLPLVFQYIQLACYLRLAADTSQAYGNLLQRRSIPGMLELAKRI